MNLKRIVPYAALLFLSVISVIAIAGHIVGSDPSKSIQRPPGPEWFTEQVNNYRDRPVITYSHLVPALVFSLIAPLQFSSRIRNANLRRHRILGTVCLLMLPPIALSGLLLGILMPFGGMPESVLSALLFFMVLTAGAIGWLRIRRRDIAAHRAWMIRLCAWAMSITTMRIILGLFYSVKPFPDRQWFIFSFWTALIINAAVVELWMYFIERRKAS